MSIHQKYVFDGVGEKDMYLLHHEEIESIAKNYPEIKRKEGSRTKAECCFSRRGGKPAR